MNKSNENINSRKITKNSQIYKQNISQSKNNVILILNIILYNLFLKTNKNNNNINEYNNYNLIVI